MALITYKFLTSRKWCLGQLKSLRATITPSVNGEKGEGKEIGKGGMRKKAGREGETRSNDLVSSSLIYNRG